MSYTTVILQTSEAPLILLVDESRISLVDFVKMESKLYRDAIEYKLKVFKSYCDSNTSNRNDFLVIGLN